MHASHVAATYRKGRRSRGTSPRPQAAGDTGKKQRKKTRGWTALCDGCWILGGVDGEVGGDIRSHDTAIVSGSLFARVISSADLDIGIICTCEIH